MSKSYFDLLKENEDLGQELRDLKLSKVKLESWKGKDKMKMYEEIDQWVIEQHRKERDSEEVATIRTTVPKQNVDYIIIRIGELEYEKEYVPSELSFIFFDMDWKELWKERNIYFKRYYYPLKICAYLGLIDYDSKGRVRRLKK